MLGCHGKNCIGANCHNINLKRFITARSHRIGAHTDSDHTVPCGTALWGGAAPGTSCQATIVLSLRDIPQQALTGACCENRLSLRACARARSAGFLRRKAYLIFLRNDLFRCPDGERKNPVVQSSRSGFRARVRARATTHFATAFN
jgi:hypothetical protein